jgi:hypothetical protein
MLLARDAVSSKGKRASARNTMKADARSNAAIFRNIQRPYHWKRHNCQRRYALKYLHLGLNSRQQLALNGERELALNSEAQLALRSRAQLALNSERQLALNSRAHLVAHSRRQLAAHSRSLSTIDTAGVSHCHRIMPVKVGNHAQQLASPNAGRIAPVSKRNQRATSGLLLRPPPVGDT